MNREDIIRMAREAQSVYATETWTFALSANQLERFAALVAAAKDAEHAKKLKNDIHSCGPTCTRYACVAVREAVEAEREQIVQMIDNAPELVEYVKNDQGGCLMCGFTPKLAIAAIRARKDNT